MKPMGAYGEFLFFVRQIDKSEYGNKVSRHYTISLVRPTQSGARDYYTIYTVKVDKSGKVG